MSGQRHGSYDPESGKIPLQALLADLDGRKALTVGLPYGTLYLRRPGQRGNYEGACFGRGGGLAWHRSIDKPVARKLVAQGVNDGNNIETGRDVWPSRFRGVAP